MNQKRYFVLKESTLYWFVSQNDMKANNSVDLSEIEYVRNGKSDRQFVFKTKKGKEYNMFAKNQEERDKWVEVLLKETSDLTKEEEVKEVYVREVESNFKRQLNGISYNKLRKEFQLRIVANLAADDSFKKKVEPKETVQETVEEARRRTSSVFVEPVQEKPEEKQPDKEVIEPKKELEEEKMEVESEERDSNFDSRRDLLDSDLVVRRSGCYRFWEAMTKCFRK